MNRQKMLRNADLNDHLSRKVTKLQHQLRDERRERRKVSIDNEAMQEDMMQRMQRLEDFANRKPSKWADRITGSMKSIVNRASAEVKNLARSIPQAIKAVAAYVSRDEEDVPVLMDDKPVDPKAWKKGIRKSWTENSDVEVWSDSEGKWLPGYIEEAENEQVTVYYRSGATEKTLSRYSKNLRSLFKKGDKVRTEDGTVAKIYAISFSCGSVEKYTLRPTGNGKLFDALPEKDGLKLLEAERILV